MLTGRGLSKSFGCRRILKAVDIDVLPGEITVLIGPSGSGKTTALRTLALLDEPDDGVIQFEERSFQFPRVQKKPYSPPWPELTVVFQQLFLWPHMTLRENILLPTNGRLRSVEAEAMLDKLVAQFDMGDFIDRHPNQVSIGQRQRAALARALMLRPRYILLDEITSALDVEQVAVVLAHLQALRDEGIGMLLVTHLIGFAERAASRVIFLDDGEVLATGGPDQLRDPDHPRLKRFLSLIESAQ